MFGSSKAALAICIGLALASGPAMAGQPAVADERKAVLTTVDAFFAALRTKDSESFAALMLEGSPTYAQIHSPDGKVELRRRSKEDQLQWLQTTADRIDERYFEPIVMVHRSIATVWASYEFELNGARTHCGVDIFGLLKVEGVWRIGSAMWTVEPTGCPVR